jgi:phosphatidate cytidylyltransferase
MTTRLVAAVVALGILLPLLLLGGVPGAAFIVSMAMVICLGEYAQMAFPADFRYAFYWLCLTALPLAFASIAAPREHIPVIVAALCMLTMAQVTLEPPEPLSGSLDRLGRYAVGVLWVGGLLPFLMRLRLLEDGLGWVLLAMVIAWMSDTGAYFAGKSMGRTPLYPLVSPNKTWEGVVGGVLAGVVGAFGVRFALLPSLSVVDCVVLGVVGSLMGVLGDLSESLVKRAMNVKDSGWVMPGHGGLLDRVDALMFVAPTVFGYYVFTRGL